MENCSFLQYARRDSGYKDVMISTCEKFAADRDGVEFFIECNADAGTFQRCYDKKED